MSKHSKRAKHTEQSLSELLVANAQTYLSAVAGFAALVFLLFMSRGSAAACLDRVEFFSWAFALTAAAAMSSIAPLLGKTRRAKLSEEAQIRWALVAVFINAVISMSTLGFLAKEESTNRWVRTKVQLLSEDYKSVRRKGGAVDIYPIFTVKYEFRGIEHKATILSDVPSDDGAEMKIAYVNPNNPKEISQNRGLSSRFQLLVWSLCASFVSLAALCLKILRSNASYISNSSRIKLTASEEGSKAIGATEKEHKIYLYDPIPGANKEVIIDKTESAE